MLRLIFTFVSVLIMAGAAFLLAQPRERHISEAAPASAQVVASGEFRDGDPSHPGSGLLKVLNSADGQTIIRLENLKVRPGPDLFLYLVEEADPLFPEDITSAYISLGDLKAETGDQNYAVPTNIDLSEWNSVAVWCQLYEVLFAVATIEPN